MPSARLPSWPAPPGTPCYGQIYNNSLGAKDIWKAGMFHLLIAVAVPPHAIHHIRANEETGYTELIDSTAVGRYSQPSRDAGVVGRSDDYHRHDQEDGIAHPTFRPMSRWPSRRRWPAPVWSSSPWPSSSRQAPDSFAAPC